MNIPAIVAQNVSNKLRNKEIQDEAKISHLNYNISLYYNNTINSYKQVCEEIYGKLPYIADSTLGNLFRKIKQIMENTGRTINEMIHDIRTYLGYNASIQRIVNGKPVLVSPQTIAETWKSVNSRKGIIAVENVLYLN